MLCERVLARCRRSEFLRRNTYFSRSLVEALLSVDTRTGERRTESGTSEALGATTCPFLLADEGIVISNVSLDPLCIITRFVITMSQEKCKQGIAVTVCRNASDTSWQTRGQTCRRACRDREREITMLWTVHCANLSLPASFVFIKLSVGGLPKR